MRFFHSRAQNDDAVSPVVAVILLLAITIVLTSVMYLTVTQLIPPVQQNSMPFAIYRWRSPDGRNWVLEVSTVGQGVDPTHVYLEVLNPDGGVILRYTPLTNITGFMDDSPVGYLNPGDRVILPIASYPERSYYTFKDDQRILCEGTLVP